MPNDNHESEIKQTIILMARRILNALPLNENGCIGSHLMTIALFQAAATLMTESLINATDEEKQRASDQGLIALMAISAAEKAMVTLQTGLLALKSATN